MNPKAISPEKLIPASVYVRVESDDDPNESSVALQSNSSTLDDSNLSPVKQCMCSGSISITLDDSIINPVEPSTSSGFASITLVDLNSNSAEPSLSSSSASITLNGLNSNPAEPSTDGSASICDQIDDNASNSQSPRQMDIYSAREKLVNYEMELSLEDVLLFEQQYIEGRNVEDPAFSQWVFLKSQLDHFEYLFHHRKPVQLKLEETCLQT